MLMSNYAFFQVFYKSWTLSNKIIFKTEIFSINQINLYVHLTQFKFVLGQNYVIMDQLRVYERFHSHFKN